jgi:4-amino-4-deoxy-L-arabinose transferase-like glycosyltransferase
MPFAWWRCGDSCPIYWKLFRPLTLLLVAALFFLYFTGLDDAGLLGPDEPRYAAIGRQMARSNDFVTPTLWGSPWYEKPPLLYWMVAAGNRLGLGPELGARLPVELAAVAFILFFYRLLASRLTPRIALYSSIILATSAAWIAYAFSAVTDIPLATCLGVAVLLTVFEETGGRGLTAGIFLGLAVLAKGPVAWILFAPVLLFKFQWKRAAIILATSLAVSAPWYLLVYQRNGWPFVQEFFIRHHFQRFASDELKHVRAWHFYIPVMLGAVFPWTPLYGFFALRAKSLTQDPRVRMIAFYVLWVVVFFSVSRNKLPGYILPAVPGVALLFGTAAEKAPRWVLAFCAWFLSIIPALAHILGPALDNGLTRVAIPNPPVWGLALAGVATLCCLGNRTFGMTAIGLLFLIPVSYMKSVAFPVLDRTVSARQAAKRGTPACVDGSQRDLYYGLNYYLDVRRKLPVCGEHETPP